MLPTTRTCSRALGTHRRVLVAVPSVWGAAATTESRSPRTLAHWLSLAVTLTAFANAPLAAQPFPTTVRLAPAAGTQLAAGAKPRVVVCNYQGTLQVSSTLNGAAVEPTDVTNPGAYPAQCTNPGWLGEWRELEYTIPVGTSKLEITACNGISACEQRVAAYTMPGHGLSVHLLGGISARTQYSPATAHFSVTSSGTIAETIDLTATCVSNATACAILDGSGTTAAITLAPGDHKTVTVQYRAGATLGYATVRLGGVVREATTVTSLATGGAQVSYNGDWAWVEPGYSYHPSLTLKAGETRTVDFIVGTASSGVTMTAALSIGCGAVQCRFANGTNQLTADIPSSGLLRVPVTMTVGSGAAPGYVDAAMYAEVYSVYWPDEPPQYAQGNLRFTIPATYVLNITPDSGLATALQPGQSGSTTFTVQNLNSSNQWTAVDFTATCTGPLTNCRLGWNTPYQSISLQPGTSTITVNYAATTGTGTGTLSLQGVVRATGLGDHGSVSVPIAFRAVAVTPDGGTATNVGRNGANQTSFDVTNTGTIAGTINVSVACTGLASCGLWNGSATVSSLPITLAAGATQSVTATYSAGSTSGTATITTTAQFADATTITDQGTRTLHVLPNVAPTVTLAPSDTTTTTGTITIVASWCDADGAIASRAVTLGGTLLSDNFTPATVTGCASAGTSTWTGVPLSLWGQTLTASITDDAGGTGSTSRTLTFAPQLVAFLPEVSTESTSRTFPPGVPVSVDFQVRNAGSHTTTYALLADCAGLASCVASRASLTLVPGATDVVTLSFLTSAAPDSERQVTLRATFTDPLGRIVADTGLVTVSNSIPQPVVLAHDTTVTVQPNSSVAQVFRIRAEGGSGSVTYQLSASCGGWTSGGCAPGSSSVTLAAGQEVTMGVHYVSGPPVAGPEPTPTPVRLIATLAGVAADTGTAHTKLADVLPPMATFLTPSVDTLLEAIP